jgi:hypothetical protein
MTRYIGKTCQPLATRLHGHLSSARNGGATHRDCWLRSVMATGARPRIDLIELSDGDGCREEMKWIARLTAMNWPLVNGTIGGEGVMMGRRHSLESRIKIGFKGLGRKQSRETIELRASKMRGRKCPDSTKSKIAASHLGIKMSDEARVAMHNAHAKPKLNPGNITEIRNSDDTQRALAERYDVDQSHISRIRARKRWSIVKDSLTAAT